jgi:threonylcarbamoyladenosine tRNA methylthiotransferase MtaB
MSSPEILTFGCRLNTHESEVMRDHARAAGMEDVIILNTCAVTSEAERQARQTIRRLGREQPGKKIIVTGCAAQINSKQFSDMPEVSRVIGNDLKLKAETWTNEMRAAAQTERVLVNDIFAVRETAGHLVKGFTGHTRAFVQVQNGCDHRCTFCIIPYGRGNSRSVPVEIVSDQVCELVSAGYHEVVVTGVDVTSYGHDLPGTPTLGAMLRRVLQNNPDLPRVRLSSLDPVEMDEDLWALLADEPRFMPHLHISLQAGDDMILKRMKRRHLRHDVVEFCQRARALRPDVVFGADIIAGFPTETDGMFENTLRLVDECAVTYLHVFPYSPRPGTPAARMPMVPADVRKARAAELRAAGAAQLNKFLQSQIGKPQKVLIEQDGLSGHTEHFAVVKFAEKQVAGSIVEITPAGIENDKLIVV